MLSHGWNPQTLYETRPATSTFKPQLSGPKVKSQTRLFVIYFICTGLFVFSFNTSFELASLLYLSLSYKSEPIWSTGRTRTAKQRACTLSQIALGAVSGLLLCCNLTNLYFFLFLKCLPVLQSGQGMTAATAAIAFFPPSTGFIFNTRPWEVVPLLLPNRLHMYSSFTSSFVSAISTLIHLTPHSGKQERRLLSRENSHIWSRQR